MLEWIHRSFCALITALSFPPPYRAPQTTTVEVVKTFWITSTLNLVLIGGFLLLVYGFLLFSTCYSIPRCLAEYDRARSAATTQQSVIAHANTAFRETLEKTRSATTTESIVTQEWMEKALKQLAPNTVIVNIQKELKEDIAREMSTLGERVDENIHTTFGKLLAEKLDCQNTLITVREHLRTSKEAIFEYTNGLRVIGERSSRLEAAVGKVDANNTEPDLDRELAKIREGLDTLVALLSKVENTIKTMHLSST